MDRLADQFVGCLLGSALGDAIGAPFEGMPAEAIYYQFGSSAKILAHPPVDQLQYTDDTQMTIGVAEALIARGRIEEDALCEAFARNYERGRGYGQGARKIIELMQIGGDWGGLAETIFPGGSLGNGAAMRVAPVGLLFHHDFARVLSEARLSALPTHRHPIGIEAAQLLALAVAWVIKEPNFSRSDFFDALAAHATLEEFQWQLAKAAKLQPDDSIAFLGNTLEAHRSVGTAIACFASAPDSYPAVIGRALTQGDDVDTIAAMAGAISGARLGAGALPPHLLDLLENGKAGRDYISQLAMSLRGIVRHPVS